MKKILYSLLTLAAALTVASCQKEPVNASDPNFGGKPVTMAFDVNLGVATKAVTASVFDDGKTVDKLYVAAFDATSGALVSTSLVGDNAVAMSAGTATVKLTLAKGGNYNVVFFAMKANRYTVNFANGNVATFAYTTGATYNANDAGNDAFYAMKTVTNAATNSDPISVELKRPFAQINVFSSNRPSETATYESTMTVKKVPTSFDLFNGAVGGTLADVTFVRNPISATSPNTEYPYWLGMNYVLVPSAGKVDLSFQEMNGMAEALNLTGITVKANNRTNLVGAIYDLNADVTYNVTVGGLEGEGTGDIAGEDQTVTISDNSTYTTANPLNINAATAATQSVTLSFNGNTIADVEAGATTPGEKVTAASSDVSVATAAVSGNDVVITPVGNGDAVITVSVPGYTKATYKATTFEIPVHVEGVTVPKKDVTITVTAPADGKLAIETGKTGTITAAAKDADNNDVAIVYTTSDETVATVENGTVTGVKAGTATITLSTAETETLNAAESKTVTVTVADPETPPTTAKTIADIKTAIGTSTEAVTFDAITLGTVVVTTVNGGQAYMEDATGGLQLYLSNHGLEVGKSYTGVKVTKGQIRNGVYQISDFDKTDATVADAEVPTTTVAISALIAEGGFAKYESMHVKLADVTFAAAVATKNTTVSVKQGNDAIDVYVRVDKTVGVNAVADVTGIVSLYNNNVQLSVFAEDDIAVKSSGVSPAEISGLNATAQIVPGGTLDLSGVSVNSGATLSFKSSDESIATISGTTVTVSSNATVGATAVITVSAPAVTGYSDASATCTITVKDPTTPAGDPTVISKTMKEIQEGNNYTISAGNEVTCYTSFSMDSNITVSTSGSANCGSFWANGSDIQWRLYQNKSGDVTITAANGTIKSVTITYAVTNTGVLKNGTSTVESGVEQTVDATSVTYTVGNSGTATNGQVRITEISVTYN